MRGQHRTPAAGRPWPHPRRLPCDPAVVGQPASASASPWVVTVMRLLPAAGIAASVSCFCEIYAAHALNISEVQQLKRSTGTGVECRVRFPRNAELTALANGSCCRPSATSTRCRAASMACRVPVVSWGSACTVQLSGGCRLCSKADELSLPANLAAFNDKLDRRAPRTHRQEGRINGRRADHRACVSMLPDRRR